MTQMVTPQDIKLVLVQKITFVLRKINKKTAATRAALFDSNHHHHHQFNARMQHER